MSAEESRSLGGRAKVVAIVGAAAAVAAIAVVAAVGVPMLSSSDRQAAVGATTGPNAAGGSQSSGGTAGSVAGGAASRGPSGSPGQSANPTSSASHTPGAPTAHASPGAPGNSAPNAPGAQSPVPLPPAAPSKGYVPPPLPPGAPAKPNPWTLNQICGSGMSVVDSHGVGSATIYLMYDNATGVNCVTTTVPSSTGPTSMSAFLARQGGPANSDSGSYSYYAGPVKVSAKATCVKWGGSYGGASWTSGWSHCG